MKINKKNMLFGMLSVIAPLCVNAQSNEANKIPPANYYVLSDTCQGAQTEEGALSVGSVCTLTLKNGCPGKEGVGPKGLGASFVAKRIDGKKTHQRVSNLLNYKSCPKGEEDAQPLVLAFKVTTTGTYNLLTQRTGRNQGFIYHDFATETGEDGQILRVSKKVKLFVKGK